MFKDSFKYYKARKSPPNLEHVIDPIKSSNQNVRYFIFICIDDIIHYSELFRLGKSLLNLNMKQIWRLNLG
jgi:hypothetical protein